MKRIFTLTWTCAALCLTGCGSKESNTKTLTLYVAASLTDVIQEVSEDFEKEHDLKVVFNFAGSGALAQQLLATPRADIYLSASQRWMDEVEKGGRIMDGTRSTLLSNNLVVIAHKTSNWELKQPSQLAELPFKFLAIGDPDSVPAGKYAKTWLESINIDDEKTLWSDVQGRISPTPDVRAAMAQVEGSADVAGIVYGTDYMASEDKVRLLYQVPLENSPKIEYPVAILAEAAEPELAAEFLEFLSNPKVRDLFRKHGFVVAE